MLRFRTALLACAAFALLGGGPAYADTTATLTGETLAGEALPGSAHVACDLTGDGTVSFTATGTATGPYPGTFTETGSLTFEASNVVAFTASFTIDSGATQVTGTKRLVIPGGGACRGTTGSDVDQTAVGTITVRYEATIVSPTGRSTDQGVSGFGFSFTGAAETGLVNEGFNSDREFATLRLSPETAIDDVGTTHTVTATVLDSLLNPISGAHVLFSVTGSVVADGSCITDSTGTCSFTYPGPALPGADLITACFDFDRSGTADPGERCASATKVWIFPVAPPGAVTGGGYVDRVAGSGQVAFGFNAKSDGAGRVDAECNVVDQVTGTHVKCLDATTLAAVATHATFLGEALVNGVATNYRIDVDDLGEPGSGRDTFKLQTDSGYVVGGVVTGGDVQVHM